jgi:hypothetical protein
LVGIQALGVVSIFGVDQDPIKNLAQRYSLTGILTDFAVQDPDTVMDLEP